MNKKLSLEGYTLKYLFQKNKLYLLPLIVIFTSLVLFLNFTLPFFGEYKNLQDLRSVEERKLQILRDNYEILTNLDERTLDSQLAIATDALPSGKDFASILNTISIAANNAGVILGDYEFQVGDLDGDAESVNYPFLELVLSVSGGVRPTLNFVDELYNSVPIAEVINMEINNNRSIITVIFYYKTLPGTPSVTSPIKVLSPNNISTINNVFTWNNARLTGELIPTPSTSSAETTPF